MAFIPKEPRKKVAAGYNTLYMSQELIDRVTQIAKENNLSFNSVVVSMIEHCLQEDQESSPTQIERRCLMTASFPSLILNV